MIPWYLMAKGKGGGGYKTASGPIVSVNDALAAPLRSLVANIEPVQAGSGDPSPDNVRPISGWSAVNVCRTGKNLSSVSSWSGHSGVAGVLDTPIPPNTEFTMSGIFSRDGAATNGCAILFGFSDGTDSGWTSLGVNSGRKSGTKTYTKEIVSVKFYSSNVGWADSQNYTLTVEEFQLELGSTATAYEPYSGNQYTLQLGQTVYGGTLDVTNGVLTVDRAMVDLGTLPWQIRESLGGFSATVTPTPQNQFKAISSCYPYKGIYSSVTDKAFGYVYNNHVFVKDSAYSDAASLKTALNGQTLVYELATPITIPLIPTEISTLQGQNNLWADSGDVTVTYLASGGANADLMNLAVAFMGRK